MIDVKELHKSFEGEAVLCGLSLSVARGEMLALIGKSGHGKSVLLRHLAGLVRPDAGRITIDGLDLATLGGRALRKLRARFGFVFQGGALFDSISVYDNVAFPLREKTRLCEDEIREKVSAQLALVGLEGAAGKLPAQISGGMVKRTALARALIMAPEIMFFDEPTTGLDPIIGASILKLIQACHRRFGFTGVIVTHQIPRVFAAVQRVALLHEGRIRFMGTPEQMEANDDSVVRGFIRGSAPEPDLG